MSQRRLDLTTGLFKFQNLEELLKYLRDASEYYQKEAEKYGDKLGSALRTSPGEAKPASEEKKNEKGDKKGDQKKAGGGSWVKMGTLMLSTSGSPSASTEVMYQVHEDLKLKLAKTNEAIKSLEQNASTLIPQGSIFSLYVRNGVPERVIADVEAKKKPAFSFDGKFRVV
jgi:hypothetical protein